MRIPIAALALALALVAPAAALAADDAPPSLKARALLPADASAPAPWPGAPNLEPLPAPNSSQPVGGFSALLDAPGKDAFWAMPDNGFGAKANSRSFLLRVYRVRARFETKRGGPGTVAIQDWITLRDPDHKIPFAIVREGTTDRLLTGGDLDIESMRVDRHGNLWFGEEFGPFLVKTDAGGKVLQAPIPLPGVKSPDYPPDVPAPFDGPANLGRSNGFEGMALTRDGRSLLAALEGPVAGDDPLVRRVHEFDIDANRYSGRVWTYRVADPALLISDLTVLDGHDFVALERDNFQGVAARHKRGFVVRFDAFGTVGKREVVDLLDIADPHAISLPGRPGDIGLRDPFSMPYVTIESVLPLGHNRLAIVNDTNFGSTGRNPALPDDSDFIVVKVPGLSD
ncbi:MAG: esterase-like activity of phytase family protein [Solirubrobacteraceae bacterium]